MSRPWFDEHPLGRRLLALSIVAVAIFVANSAIQRYVLRRLAVGGHVYHNVHEHIEARLELIEVAEELEGAQAKLAAVLAARSPEHARQLLAAYAERLASVDTRFADALRANGLENATPLVESAQRSWLAYKESAKRQLLRDGAQPSREEISAFLNGKDGRRYTRLLDELEAAGNALRLEAEAHEEEVEESVERAQWLLDAINGGLGLLLIAYLWRSTGAMTHAVAREAQQAHFEALRADVIGALSGEGKLSAALQRCAEALVRHLDARLARVWLLEEKPPRLELQASAGPAAPPRSAPVPIASEQGELWRVTHEMRPYVSAVLANDARLGLQDWARGEGLLGFVGVPLRVGNRPVGALEMYTAEPLPETAVAALGALVDALAQSIERWRAEAARAAYATELERSNSELERFAYVASHDLQEPLRMVGSYTQLLARRYKGKLDSDADEFIHFTVDAVTRMQRLLKDLLTYSRVGSQQKELVPTPCPVVVERALANLQAAIQESGAKVTVEALPTVLGDEVQLEQLFQNLIGNGIKFRGAQPPEVRIAATQHEDGQWLFSVKDNGIGIAPEHFQRLFVVFQRLHSASEYPGTGIGLAICKKIVERHGGRIWVESAPGKGSTFFFTLRAAPSTAATSRVSA